MDMWGILLAYHEAFAAGLFVTLKLCALVWLGSFGFGTALGLVSSRWPQSAGLTIKAISTVLAGIPAIVFLFWLHYPAQAALGIVVDPFITAACGLSVLGAFMVAEAIGSAIRDFPRQYIIAARVCGISQQTIFRRIVLPMIIRAMTPSAILIGVTLFQMTLFSSFISVGEIFRVAQQVNSIAYRPIEIFTALAMFCVLICVPLQVLAHNLGRKWTRDLSER